MRRYAVSRLRVKPAASSSGELACGRASCAATRPADRAGRPGSPRSRHTHRAAGHEIVQTHVRQHAACQTATHSCSPSSIIEGTPIHSASQTVVCPLKGNVSSAMSISWCNCRYSSRGRLLTTSTRAGSMPRCGHYIPHIPLELTPRIAQHQQPRIRHRRQNLRPDLPHAAGRSLLM